MRLYDGGVVAKVPMRQGGGDGCPIARRARLTPFLVDAPESLAEMLLFTMTVTMLSVDVSR